MSGERKRIRDAIKAIVESVYVGNVIASRVYDARDFKSFVSVYFDSGDDDWDGLKSSTTASIFVSYLNSELTDDDELDQVADAIHNALGAANIAPDLIQGFIPAGFEYLPEKESAYGGIALRYTVIY